MKVQEVINRVRTTSGDQTALQYSNEQLIDWINDGIRECAVDNNLLQKSGVQQTILNQDVYTIPADVLKIHSIRWDGSKLTALNMEEFDEQYGNPGTQDVGVPIVWYIWGTELRIYPKPQAAKELRIDYLYTPLPHVIGVLDVELSLPVGYHSRIVDYCLAQVAQQDDNMTIYNMKMTEFRTGVQQLKDQPESTYDVYSSISVDSRDMGDGSGYGEWY